MFLFNTENCSGVFVVGINVTVPTTSASDDILNNVGCRAGYELDDRSSVRDVICQLNGTWSAFPDCDKGFFFDNSTFAC